MASFDQIFTEQGRQLIMALTSRLTGASSATRPNLESCLVNIRRRMDAIGATDLATYLAVVDGSPEELAHFISAVTIHTTTWFREKPHYDRLRQLATAAAPAFAERGRRAPFRVLSAGCSTGEEAYSMALVLEDVRRQHPLFDYGIEGWDVDLISVGKASHAIYPVAGLAAIGATYHRSLLVGSGPTRNLFTFEKPIRERCTFLRRSLLNPGRAGITEFDVVFCRNVLIYFSLDKVAEIVRNLVGLLKPDGHLCLGHSESIEASSFGLSVLGNATYKKSVAEVPAKSAGVVAPPPARTKDDPCPDLILIGASTGGTEVLARLVQDMPKPCPPVMIVQHIALSFAHAFAERLAQVSGLKLAAPIPGAQLAPGHLYMALGDYHIGMKWRAGLCFLSTSNAPPVHSVRPAVDILFHSATGVAKSKTVCAIILTGMGKDGGSGLAALRAAGATTYVQDEASSAVFGMPREAIALGAAEFVGNPDAIKARLFASLRNKVQKTA